MVVFLKGRRMKNEDFRKKFSAVIFLVLLAALVTSAGAQEFSRSGRLELFGIFQNMNGDTAEFSDFGVRTKFDDCTLYGFGFGINLNDNFNLNTDFLFGTTDVDSTNIGGSLIVSFDADLLFWDFNLDYNILKERLTPVLSAGIGVSTFSYSSYEEEADFSYNVGAGVRWDAADNLFIKAMYRWIWTELEFADDNLLFDGLSVSFGLMF
jgi:opacity protein-like surface antigen